MESKGKIDRNVQSLRTGIYRRTACQVIHPTGTTRIVIGIILSLISGIYRVGHTGPLHEITRSFRKTGITAHDRLRSEAHLRHPTRIACQERGIGRHRAGDVAHTAAYLDSVGRYHRTGMGTAVGQFHPAAATLVEVELAEVNPRAAAHLLIDPEGGLSSLVVNGVQGIVRALGQRFVRYVHGIGAFLFKFGLPYRYAFLSLGKGGYFPVGSHLERIFSVHVVLLGIGKAHALTGLPSVFAVLFIISGYRSVVVRYDLLDLPVPLARQQHHRSGAFEHRHQERQDKTLGEDILHRLEDPRPLPFPPQQFLLVIVPVALPHGDMAAVKSLGRSKGPVLGSHQRGRDIFEFYRFLACVLLPVITRNEFVDLLSFAHGAQTVRGKPGREAVLEDRVNIGTDVFPHGILSQYRIVIQRDLPPGHRERIQAHTPHVIIVRPLTGAAIRGKRIVLCLEKRGIHRRLGLSLQEGDPAQQGAKYKFDVHDKEVFCFQDFLPQKHKRLQM